MEGRFVESVKNAWWSMSPQEAGDGLKCIIEFKVQIICEHIELPAKLLDYFLRSNKSNINQDTTSESMRADGNGVVSTSQVAHIEYPMCSAVCVCVRKHPHTPTYTPNCVKK